MAAVAVALVKSSSNTSLTNTSGTTVAPSGSGGSGAAVILVCVAVFLAAVCFAAGASLWCRWRRRQHRLVAVRQMRAMSVAGGRRDGANLVSNALFELASTPGPDSGGTCGGAGKLYAVPYESDDNAQSGEQARGDHIASSHAGSQDVYSGHAADAVASQPCHAADAVSSQPHYDADAVASQPDYEGYGSPSESAISGIYSVPFGDCDAGAPTYAGYASSSSSGKWSTANAVASQPDYDGYGNPSESTISGIYAVPFGDGDGDGGEDGYLQVATAETPLGSPADESQEPAGPTHRFRRNDSFC